MSPLLPQFLIDLTRLPQHLHHQHNHPTSSSGTFDPDGNANAARFPQLPPWANQLLTDKSLRPLLRTLVVVVFILLFFLLSYISSLSSSLLTTVHNVATGTLYRFHSHKSASASYTQFASQNPIFMKRISVDSLNGLLKTRRKIVGGTVNNTLIAACPTNCHIHQHIISSWLSIKGVREIIIVHDSPSTEQAEKTLKSIQFMDRLGRITYINLVTQQPTSDNSNTQQKAKNKDLNEQQQDLTENSHEEAEPPTNSSSSDQSKHNTKKRFKGDEGTVNNKNNATSSNNQQEGEHEELSSSSFKSTDLKEQANYDHRWFRSKAFNLGAALSSGKNLIFTDCRTLISTEAILQHDLPLNLFYVSIGSERSHISDIKPIQLIYVRKQDFITIHGFDERIDIVGYDFVDFVQRLVHFIPDLSWNNMKSDSTHIIKVPSSTNYILSLKPQKLSSKTLLSSSSSSPSFNLIPFQLAFYTYYFAKNEVPTWNGENSIIQKLNPDTISVHEQFVVKILRSQHKSVEGHSRQLAIFPVPNRKSDFRIWIHAIIQSNILSKSMLDELSKDNKAKVFLKAHRKVLHDHHGIPFKLLNIIEGENDSDSHSSFNQSKIAKEESDANLSIISTNVNSTFSEDGTFSKSMNSTSNISTGYNGTVDAINGAENNNVVHDEYATVPINDLENRIDGYAPILLDILWRKSKVLVVHIQADYAMELFRSISWSISLAVAHNRALVIMGDLQGTSILKLINIKKTRETLKQKYNIQLDVIGRKQPSQNSCNNIDESVKKFSCWFNNDSDNIMDLWDEYHIKEIESISEIADNSLKHILLYVAGRDIHNWDNNINDLSIWQKQLEINAFSSIQISSYIRDLVDQKSKQGWNQLENRTTLWITRASRDSQILKSFAFGYLKYLEQRMNGINIHNSHNNNHNIKYSKYSFHYSSDHSFYRYHRGGGSGGKNNKLAALLFMSDHAEMRSRMSTSTTLNSMQNVADLWVVMQCKRIVFDSEEIPSSWKGTDDCILEWRKVNGIIPVEKKDISGVVHVKSSDVGTNFAFHEMEFTNEDDDNDDAVVKRETPSSILAQ